jgi:hypothetical protein
LKSDALDFLGDTITYGHSLYVLGMPIIRGAWTALFKGASLAAIGLWVLGSTVYYSFFIV